MWRKGVRRGAVGILTALLLVGACTALALPEWSAELGRGNGSNQTDPANLEDLSMAQVNAKKAADAEHSGDVRTLKKCPKQSSEGAVLVRFLSVGQAEAILIDDGKQEILIDGGEKEAATHVIDAIKPYVEGPLDYVIATHAHDDHIGGLPEIMDAFRVSEVIDNGRHSDLESYLEYREALQQETEEGAVYRTAKNETIALDGASLQLIEMERAPADPNESSIVCRLSCGGVTVLLMSDLDTVVERSNLQRFSDVDILKVGHHGSRTATSDEFLEIVKPEAAVITAGVNNRFGLPSRDILSKLLESEITVFGTFRSGDITLTIPKIPPATGPAYWFDTDQKLTMFDAGAKKISGLDGSMLPGVLSGQAEGNSSATVSPKAVEAKEAVYVGNTKTKRFHTMACPAGARIADRHAVYFRSRSQAVEQGYHSCGICRP